MRGDHEKHDVVDDLLVRQALREHEGDHVAGRRALSALQLGPPLLDDPSDGVPPAAARGEAAAVGGEGQVDRDRPDAPHQLLELHPELPPDGVPPEAEDGRAREGTVLRRLGRCRRRLSGGTSTGGMGRSLGGKGRPQEPVIKNPLGFRELHVNGLGARPWRSYYAIRVHNQTKHRYIMGEAIRARTIGAGTVSHIGSAAGQYVR